MSYALVIGGKGGRRFEAVRSVAAALAARGLRVGGFTQRTVRPETGPASIEMTRLGGGPTLPLARSGAAGAAADPASCSFAFDAGAIDQARRWVEEDARVADVVVLDGIGALELGGGGHRSAVEKALAAGVLALLAVRDDQLVYALEALGLAEPVAAFRAGDGPAALAVFVDDLVRACTAPHQGRG
jgi:nucleoside-triphosphatase THEP1